MIKLEEEDWLRNEAPELDTDEHYRTSAPNIMYQVGWEDTGKFSAP